ncbi:MULTISPECIES: DUF308 domain-containing protein [unclassified Beijerinckia]|uniref:HdeD family acid-resistance protein n=1 Tax=unclassified Beijerinckia TaxID=2638183 RepID=UPI000895CFFF|nr:MULTISPECIES: DUF308 domain-containing protein [unclassified Beijerinckia]MDH7796857.1 uncharacterized membrane protein HdeD (DUF308 family) [Beijerinckia sp. GAS462]SEC62597.1 Uncharacterized membrane protein HdeD, DUF308 family [Beijerinckia sp. 28-YEA-48]
MTDKSTTDAAERDAFRAYLLTAVARLAPRARALTVIGFILVLLGVAVVAIITQSRVVSLIPVGLLMVVGGVFELGIGHNARGDDARTTPWARAAALNVAAGIFVIAAPYLSIAWLSGLAGICILAAGIVRLRCDFALSLAHRSAVMPLSAAITALIGVLIVTRWPGENLVLLGVMLGVELIMRGWAWVGFGVTLRRALSRAGSSNKS